LTKAHLDLAKPNLEIWNAAECSDFVTRLGQLLEIAPAQWPADVYAINALFSEERDHSRPVFMVPRDWEATFQQSVADNSSMALLSLTAALSQKAAVGAHPHWNGYYEEGQVTLIFHCSPKRNKSNVLAQIFRPYSANANITFSPRSGVVKSIRVELGMVARVDREKLCGALMDNSVFDAITAAINTYGPPKH